MRVISVNVGRPRTIDVGGQTVRTGIFKAPVSGRVKLSKLNLAGDRQADLSVHGGRDKAVYLYPSEHYRYWQEQLPEIEMPWGMFGENLTTEGLDEQSAHIGDRFRIGGAVLEVTKPRMACYKLGIKFGLRDMVKRFWDSGRSGFYLLVVEEGMIEAGDAITRIAAAPDQVSVAGIVTALRTRSAGASE